jgi:hypothetical protein
MFEALPAEVESVGGGQEEDLLRADSTAYLQ